MKNIKNKNLKKGGNMRLKIFLTILITGFLFLAVSYPAGAVIYNFNPITWNSIEPDEVGNNISMDVTLDSGVLFTFTNNYYWEPNTPSVITNIYFFDPTGLLGTDWEIGNVDGVDLVIDEDLSGKLPGAGTVVPPLGNPTFQFEAYPPPTQNGINNFADSGDIFTIIFDGEYNDMLDALNAGTLRIGLHVQSLPCDLVENDDYCKGDEFGASDGFINQVPIPATAWMFGAGLMGLVGIRRKLRK